MFTLPATGGGNTGGDRRQGSRREVRTPQLAGCAGCRSSSASCPVVCLAEEIETPGEGQVRALITIAGNPARLDTRRGAARTALASLDFMVSVDIYVNETTRHADVILPPEAELARGHYDLALYSLAIRNVANYSPPLVDLEPDEMPEWRTMLRLAGVLQGLGPDADVRRARRLRRDGPRGEGGRRAPARMSRVATPTSSSKALAVRRGPERILDLMLRTGPYGDGFGARSRRALARRARGAAARHRSRTAAAAGARGAAHADGDDRARARTVRRRRAAAASRARSQRDADDRDGAAMVLVGRRDLRSNNSWMHNLNVLVKGKPRCTVHVHPDDATPPGCRRRCRRCA